MKDKELIERGKRVLRLEREAIATAEERLGDSFSAAVKLISGCSGRVIVSGVGKSGLIGRKIAATLTSTGTPATFLHPADSVHGDLGIVGSADIAILLSKSGESDEIIFLLDHLKRLGVRIISITGEQNSAIARHSDLVLDAWVKEEACPHDLAPTTSTAVALALGDALAIALLEENGFDANDFARLHPGGSLGRKLLTRVADVMVTTDLPLLTEKATMREVIVQLAERRGIAVLCDLSRAVKGVITAGDLTRVMERENDIFALSPVDLMTRTPRTAAEDELGSAVVFRMEKHGIMAMPVVAAGGQLVGVIHLHDLMRAGVV